MSTVRRRIMQTLLVAAAAILAAMAAIAQDSAEATYLQYQRAIHAAELCRRDRPFGTPEQTRMAVYIDGKIDNAIGAGRRLQLIEQAKAEVDKLADNDGCGGKIAEILDIYYKELAPLLAQ